MCLKVLKKYLQKEMTQVASFKEGYSCLRQKDLESLQNFSWETLNLELQSKAPTLYAVLEGCVNVRRKGKKSLQTQHSKNLAILGICAAILLRHRNHHLNLVQRIISLILFSGHAGKKVYSNGSCIG